MPLEKASGSRTSAGSGAGETSRRCRLCAKLHKEGQFCPVCDVVWQWANCPAMVGCDSCDFWVHATCDPKAQAVMDAEAEAEAAQKAKVKAEAKANAAETDAAAAAAAFRDARAARVESVNQAAKLFESEAEAQA